MRVTHVRRSIVAGGVSALAPAWVALAVANGLTVGQIATIAGASPSHGLSATNNLFAVAPSNHASLGSNSGVMAAWGGGQVCPGASTHGRFIIHNGGHTDTNGTEAYGFDIGTRTWSRVTECSPDSTFDYSGLATGWRPAHGLQVNGSPQPAHTYSMVRYHPGRNSFYTFLAQSAATPSYVPHVGELPLSGANAYVWQSRATAGYTLPAEGWSTYDSLRDRFIVHGASGAAHMLVYYPTTDTWEEYTQSNEAWAQASYTVGAYDHNNDFNMVVAPNGTVYGHAQNDLTSAAITLTTSGKPSITSSGAFEYCTERGGFIWHPGTGDATYLVTKGAGHWSVATWLWTLLTANNSIAPETNESGGIFSKAGPISWGSTTVLIICKRTGQNGTGAVYGQLLSI